MTQTRPSETNLLRPARRYRCAPASPRLSPADPTSSNPKLKRLTLHCARLESPLPHPRYYYSTRCLSVQSPYVESAV